MLAIVGVYKLQVNPPEHGDIALIFSRNYGGYA